MGARPIGSRVTVARRVVTDLRITSPHTDAPGLAVSMVAQDADGDTIARRERSLEFADMPAGLQQALTDLLAFINTWRDGA